MKVKRKQYDIEDLAKYITEYLNGTKMRIVKIRYPNVPERTYRKRAKMVQSNLAVRHPGPAPILSNDVEDDLAVWCIEMQRQGLPVDRDAILNEIYNTHRGSHLTRSQKNGLSRVNLLSQNAPSLITVSRWWYKQG